MNSSLLCEKLIIKKREGIDEANTYQSFTKYICTDRSTPCQYVIQAIMMKT
jgi:hypothetical protein